MRIVDVHLAAERLDIKLAGFAHRAVVPGLSTRWGFSGWPAGVPLQMNFYRVSAARETGSGGPSKGLETCAISLRPASAAEFMRRTASSHETATALRSVPASTAMGAPDDTTT